MVNKMVDTAGSNTIAIDTTTKPGLTRIAIVDNYGSETVAWLNPDQAAKLEQALLTASRSHQ